MKGNKVYCELCEGEVMELCEHYRYNEESGEMEIW